jgi:hypothetical protein
MHVGISKKCITLKKIVGLKRKKHVSNLIFPSILKEKKIILKFPVATYHETKLFGVNFNHVCQSPFANTYVFRLPILWHKKKIGDKNQSQLFISDRSNFCCCFLFDYKDNFLFYTSFKSI